ncbi:cyanophycinase [Chitinimonas sp.]|uniref:cyanophycinase n=1 Tax=Chitinimonas sp. TaxID=1934313 RepID=UPI002F93AD88
MTVLATAVRLFLAATLSAGALAQAPLPVGNAAPTGYAVPIGGALSFRNAEVWGRLVQLAGGQGARFVVVPAAAGKPEKAGAQIAEALSRAGAQSEVLPVAPNWPGRPANEAVNDPALVEKILAAQGVYFAGGAQERIVDTLAPGGKATPLLDAIWQVYRRGGVVAGSSAGAAIMSSTMFRDAPDTLRVLQGELREGREVAQGLGFVGPALFVDQHFLKRGRIGRILPMMVAKGYKLGLGVEENSAVIVHGDEVEVIGARGALLVDLADARQDKTLGAFNLKGVKLSYLDHGDRYDLKQRTVLPSAEKLADTRIDPSATDYRPYFDNQPFYPDMLGDNTIVHAMTNLIDNKLPEVHGLAFAGEPQATDAKGQLGFSFRLYKGQGSLGWYTSRQGGEDYTVANLYLDVLPVRMQRPLFQAWSE